MHQRGVGKPQAERWDRGARIDVLAPHVPHTQYPGPSWVPAAQAPIDM